MSDIQFPAIVDNSMRKTLVKCQMAFHYQYEMGLVSPTETRVDLHAGKAYARGLEVMRRSFYVAGNTPKKAMDDGIAAVAKAYGEFSPDKTTTKTLQRMMGALAYVAAQFPIDKETILPVKLGTELAIEVQGLEELPILHPDSGEPLQYSYRFDMLGLDADNKAWVIDEKTTSQMGDKWVNQWVMDSQMTGYVWGAKKLLAKFGLEYPVVGAIINGVAIRKYDYEAVRLPVFRAEWEIERWYDQMLHDFMQARNAYIQQKHQMNLDHACAYYLNPCQFTPLCKSRNPDRLIDGSFIVRRWDPSNPD